MLLLNHLFIQKLKLMGCGKYSNIHTHAQISSNMFWNKHHY